MKKIVLAYSGGLDTSCCLKWLQNKGFEVICFSANLGSEFSPADLKKRAHLSGAAKTYVKDLQKEFSDEYVALALKAGAIYEGKYVLSTALGRPLIAKHLVDIARKEKADFVAHGCTGKGNDQVRFEVTTAILAPKIKTIAPLREWELNSREEEIDYARKHKIPIKSTKEKLYSVDKNIWGVSVEGGALEDIGKEPPENSYYFVKPLKKALNQEVYLEIEFKRGLPIKLNGKSLDFLSLISKLNKAGSQCGVGRTDVIEDRVIGIKSREIYEAPAAWILHTAHKELEALTLDRETLFFKEAISFKYAQIIYQGLWFTELKNSLDAFINQTQKVVSGTIGIKLYKGNIVITKRISVNSLYKKELATYGRGDKFDRTLAEGFIKLWAIPFQVKN
ncbi:MAG: argininosuccinate synthase [Candidatus Omnitrophica bacterium]|nr:argininosuccinate synthase [Candidatus Omnitrophota bacterium]MBU2044875.1 argininosuccinate synthase [Candidatus Omnitrophota bacterium]MBU2250796.1 argininosuccinate synthase [Candidatus Omnitrophota bacterium]MBU2473333.1 argininosuccinate synthase [Candidatus Omnitrophota bacterium]